MNNSNHLKNAALWVFLALVLLMVWQFFNQSKEKKQDVPFSEFVYDLRSNRIDKVEISGKEIEATYKDSNIDDEKDNSKVKTYFPDDTELSKILLDTNVIIEVKPEAEHFWWKNVFPWLIPILLLVFIWIYLMRQMQGGGAKALSFGKSRAKLLSSTAQKVTFQDVAGVDEAKEELQEIIEFLKDPQKFQKLGGKIPKGVLLMGPPGTGKTLLARAIAGEADVPFFSISGSDFVEMFVGVGASRVRDLFEQGKKHAPCLIFVDEIDAVGRHRGAGLGGGHDEREQTLNQLLVELDGFESNEGVIIIAATNRPDVLDPALLRPGRFDRWVIVHPPDIKGREGILKVHTKKVPVSKDVDLAVLARGTPGFSGADLSNLVNEAALLAARRAKEKVEMIDFEEAKDKVMMGKERKSLIISEDEKKVLAFHEAGHTLVSRMLPGTDPVHKVTIIPRGMALGLTQRLPIDEKHIYTRDYLLNDISILMGGRAAEELMFNSMSTGAGNDIERATNLARKMVCEWGMSEKMGPLTFGKKEEQIFLGREIAQHKDYSESTAVLIDEEVKRIVSDGYKTAKDILIKHKTKLEKLAEKLLEVEVIEGGAIDKILGLAPQKGAEPARETS